MAVDGLLRGVVEPPGSNIVTVATSWIAIIGHGHTCVTYVSSGFCLTSECPFEREASGGQGRGPHDDPGGPWDGDLRSAMPALGFELVALVRGARGYMVSASER